jgi:hypothetical protein
LFVDTWSFYVALSGLKLKILLSQPPECRDYRHAPHTQLFPVLYSTYFIHFSAAFLTFSFCTFCPLYLDLSPLKKPQCWLPAPDAANTGYPGAGQHLDAEGVSSLLPAGLLLLLDHPPQRAPGGHIVGDKAILKSPGENVPTGNSLTALKLSIAFPSHGVKVKW